MLKVVCVYKSGGDFDVSYVNRLKTGIDRNLSIPFELICLTDRISEVLGIPNIKIVPLVNGWPGWWNKIELFNLSGPALYFDLDVVIDGDITPLADIVCCLAANEIVMARDFYFEEPNSSIVGFNCGFPWIYRDFQRKIGRNPQFLHGPHAVSVKIEEKLFRGDQDYIFHALKNHNTNIIYAQDVFPCIYSYKKDLRDKKRPADCRIIVFHGKPRPTEVTL